LWIYFKTVNPFAHWLNRKLKIDRHTNFDFDTIQLVGDLSGAFIFIRSEVAMRSGYFDPDFFMYCEDTEWCQDRLSKISNLCYFPQASVVHFGGQSAPQHVMLAQAKLSLSLLWYKRGWLKYIGYVFISYLSAFSMIPLLPFTGRKARHEMKQFILVYVKLLPYILSRISKFSKKKIAGKKLIYHEVEKFLA
jgi:GT2 family glycosyltransferase